MKINLGCGYEHKKGHLNIDYRKEVKPDKLWDLGKNKLSFLKDNSVDGVYSCAFLEHIKPDEYIPFLEDLYRVSRPNSLWHFRLPFDNSGQRCNPYHFRTYSFHTFHSFREERANNESGIKLELISKLPCRFMRCIYQIFPFLKYEIEFILLVIK